MKNHQSHLKGLQQGQNETLRQVRNRCYLRKPKKLKNNQVKCKEVSHRPTNEAIIRLSLLEFKEWDQMMIMKK